MPPYSTRRCCHPRSNQLIKIRLVGWCCCTGGKGNYQRLHPATRRYSVLHFHAGSIHWNNSAPHRHRAPSDRAKINRRNSRPSLQQAPPTQNLGQIHPLATARLPVGALLPCSHLTERSLPSDCPPPVHSRASLKSLTRLDLPAVCRRPSQAHQNRRLTGRQKPFQTLNPECSHLEYSHPLSPRRGTFWC